MATELSELTNLLKIQNQTSSTNFKSLEGVIEQVFSRINTSLGAIRTIEDQQVSIMKDSQNKELLEEQLIEKDIKQGDREIINSLQEIHHVLQQQFDFDRESENKKRLSEHIQQDFQSKPEQKTDLSGMEALLKKLIETTEQSKSDSGSIVKEVAEGLGIASLMSLLKDIALKLGSFVLKNPLAVAAGAGLATGATGGSLTGSVLTGGAAGLAKGGIPGAVAGAATGAAGWAAGRIMTKDSDSRIGRWDDAAEPGSRIRTKSGDLEYGKKSDQFKFKPEIESIIKETSEKSGLDENYLRTMAHIESKGNATAFNEGSKAAGLYQFVPGTAKAYGIRGKEFDPRANAEAAAKLSLDNKKALEKAGIEATPEMLYLAHQQGSGGAKQLIKAAQEGKSFSDLSPELQKNIKSNVPGKKELSPQEFLDYWKTSYRQHAEVAGIKEEKNSVTKESTSKDTADSIKPDYSQVKEELQGRKSHKGVDVENLDAEYSSNVLNFMKDFEKETGKKVNITSGYRPPTDKEKSELGSVATTQHDVKKGAGKMAASEYGSMHGMGAAGDLTIEGYAASAKAKNSMNNMPAEYKKVWKDLAEKHNLTIPLADNAKQNEWWHIEKAGEKRGGASKAGLEGEEYTNYIKSKSLQSAIEGKGIYAPSEETQLAKVPSEKEKSGDLVATKEKNSVEGNLVEGKPSGPIKLNGKTINPGDKEYETASEQLLKSKQDINSYTKLEKELPEGKGYAEEESEIEEMDEPIQEETFSREQPLTSTEQLSTQEPSQNTENSIDSKVDAGYNNYFEDLISNLQKMLSFTGDNKSSNEETNKQESSTSSKEDTYNNVDQSSQSNQRTSYSNVENMQPQYNVDQSSQSNQRTSYSNVENMQESQLANQKSEQLSNLGVTSFGQQSPFEGISPSINNPQNPFGTMQGILGGIGSAVSMGQNIKNMGSMGGIYGAQGAIGGVQGMLGSLGIQSPVLGQVGQAIGSVGSAVQTAKNMGSMGGGGIIGGINAASGVIGAAGNIFNAAKGIGGSIFGQSSTPNQPQSSQPNSTGLLSKIGEGISSMFGFGGENSSDASSKGTGGLFSEESSQKTGNMFNDNSTLKGMADTVGDFFGIRSVDKEHTEDLSDSSNWNPIESKGIGSDSVAMKENRQKDLISEPKTESASLIPSPSTDGFSLEGATQSVQTGKEEMMMPSSEGGESPIVVNGGGGGGGGSTAGSGGSANNPSSAGVMGIDIGVRNEEASLLRAQYGSLRIV